MVDQSKVESRRAERRAQAEQQPVTLRKGPLYAAPVAQTEQPEHFDDRAVDRFAAAMKTKMAAARAKGRSGWFDRLQCSERRLARMLVEHLSKGNEGTFEDVANFAMMLHQRGEDPKVLAEAFTYFAHLEQAAPQPEQSGLLSAIEHVSEGAGMLQNLIDNIEAKGNYSAESTVLFLNQALGCIRAAVSAQGGEA